MGGTEFNPCSIGDWVILAGILASITAAYVVAFKVYSWYYIDGTSNKYFRTYSRKQLEKREQAKCERLAEEEAADRESVASQRPGGTTLL